jgi:hypothetical protein
MNLGASRSRLPHTQLHFKLTVQLTYMTYATVLLVGIHIDARRAHQATCFCSPWNRHGTGRPRRIVCMYIYRTFAPLGVER